MAWTIVKTRPRCDKINFGDGRGHGDDATPTNTAQEKGISTADTAQEPEIELKRRVRVTVRSSQLVVCGKVRCFRKYIYSFL
jgi:hypothetical protein